MENLWCVPQSPYRDIVKYKRELYKFVANDDDDAGTQKRKNFFLFMHTR